MTKRKSNGAAKHRATASELDGVYFLKLVMYVVVGSQWVWLVDSQLTKQIPLPLGLCVGVVFALHDHFKIDRKIELAVLLIAMLIGFWANIGLYITAL
jgi:hypothetical protein